MKEMMGMVLGGMALMSLRAYGSTGGCLGLSPFGGAVADAGAYEYHLKTQKIQVE